MCCGSASRFCSGHAMHSHRDAWVYVRLPRTEGFFNFFQPKLHRITQDKRKRWQAYNSGLKDLILIWQISPFVLWCESNFLVQVAHGNQPCSALCGKTTPNKTNPKPLENGHELSPGYTEKALNFRYVKCFSTFMPILFLRFDNYVEFFIQILNCINRS